MDRDVDFHHREGLHEDSRTKSIYPTVSERIFFLFFTPTLLGLIIEQTNKYAAECMGLEKFEKWNKVTVEELCAYLGFTLLMGIVHLPSLYDYWKNDEVYHYSPIPDKISRNRFHELHRYLHFVDNSTLSPPGSPDYDWLGRIRPVAEILSDNVAAVYDPGRDISIDEAMITFKEWSTLKQYMPLVRGVNGWEKGLIYLKKTW